MTIDHIALGDVIFGGGEFPEEAVLAAIACAQHASGAAGIGGAGVARPHRTSPIEWQGRLHGPDAGSRASALGALADCRALVSLTFDDHTVPVIIARFEADYSATSEIPYRIECLVIRAAASAVAGGEQSTPLATSQARALHALRALARFLGRSAARDQSSKPPKRKGQP